MESRLAINVPGGTTAHQSKRKNLRVLIADDEPLARERLREFIEAEEDLEIAGECSDGVETVQAMRETLPELVFLDVCMPKLDGFSVIAALEPSQVPSVIFVTAYDQYALRAFETNALDYLLKPFDRTRFQEALRRARETITQVQKQSRLEQISELLDRSQTSAPIHDRIAIRSRGRVVFVRFGEIDWICGADNYAELHVGKSTHLLRETITGLEERLPSGHFLRISRSLIINLDRIKQCQLKGSGNYTIILRDGMEFSVGRKYRHNLDSLLGKDD
jgi:two-component system LytT family response regulator